MRVWRVGRWVLLSVCGVAALAQAAPSQSDAPAIPLALMGAFVDDYGIRYVVSEESWRQGEYASHEIVEWNVQERFLIARNDAENRTEASLWTRIDWVLLASGTDFEWAFCYAVYDAESAAAARAGASSDRDHPRSGCNGFPFSRMRRDE